MIAHLTYGDSAELRVTNLGRRDRSNHNLQGFWLDLVKGRWLSEVRGEQQSADSDDEGLEAAQQDVQAKARVAAWRSTSSSRTRSCPASSCTQWQQELTQKFGLDAVLVLPGTVRRLERGLGGDESIFTRYPVTVASTDFIKSESRRHEFLRAAPDLVIVDEAHGSVNDDSGRGSSGRTQRYRLLCDLADNDERHLVLVTATPHSGNEGAFQPRRSARLQSRRRRPVI